MSRTCELTIYPASEKPKTEGFYLCLAEADEYTDAPTGWKLIEAIRHRGQYMRDRIAALTRRQEQIWIVRKMFGDDLKNVDAYGDMRSGFCRCRDRQGHGVEYPGVVDFRVAGLKHPLTGCAFCRCWGVSRGDIESGAWREVCLKHGIKIEGE